MSELGRDLIHRAFEAANKIGDPTFAAYSCNNLNTNLLAAGDPLVEVQREAEHGLEFAQKARFGLVIDIITPQLGLTRTLCGLTPKFGSFDDGQLMSFGSSAIWQVTRRRYPSAFTGSEAASLLLCRGLCVGRRCVTEGTTAALDSTIKF